MSHVIQLGSRWREDDKRHHRVVTVVADGLDVENPIRLRGWETVRVRQGKIAITHTGVRVTYADPKRFGRRGGYLPFASEGGLS